jgi:rod shape-determining protein MreC
MALLDNRIRTQSILINFNYIFQNFFRRLSAIIFILASLQIMCFTPNPNLEKAMLELTGNVAGLTTNFSKIIVQRYKFLINYFDFRHDLQEENIALKLENSRLRKIEDKFTVILDENKSLKKHLNFISNFEQKFIHSKLVSASATIYRDSALIHSGESDGVKKDSLAINEEGLIGRVTRLSENYSNITLITDFESRVPVISASSHCQAIVAGNGESEASLLYIPGSNKLQVGEILLTSGDGRVYPAGIPVARVSKITDEEIYVTPIVRLDEVDYVAIIHDN